MIVVLLILLTEIHMCFCVHAYYGTCKPNEECTVLQWKEWGMCRGNCRNPITQVRKRAICADFLMVQPFTRANVKNTATLPKLLRKVGPVQYVRLVFIAACPRNVKCAVSYF